MYLHSPGSKTNAPTPSMIMGEKPEYYMFVIKLGFEIPNLFS